MYSITLKCVVIRVAWQEHWVDKSEWHHKFEPLCSGQGTSVKGAWTSLRHVWRVLYQYFMFYCWFSHN